MSDAPDTYDWNCPACLPAETKLDDWMLGVCARIRVTVQTLGMETFTLLQKGMNVQIRFDSRSAESQGLEVCTTYRIGEYPMRS